MKLDTSHAHSVEAYMAINKVIGDLNKEDFEHIFHLLCTEWADDNDLKEFAELIQADRDGTKGDL